MSNAEISRAPEQEIRERAELRVLHVFGSLGVGGAETWLIALLKYFREAGDSLPVKIRTDICITSGEPAVFDAEARRLGASLHYLRYGRNRLPTFAREFRRLLRNGDYHVIHDHQDYTAGVHFLLGAGRLPPVRIAHVHNAFYQLREHTSGWVSRVTKSAGRVLVSRLASSVAGTSAQLLDEYGYGDEIASGRAQSVYCGFDVRPFTGDRAAHRAKLLAELEWPADSKVILFVGRLGGEELVTGGRSQKNPAFALEVAARCIATDSRVRIAFAGAGDTMQPILEARARELCIEPHVTFLGVRADVPHLMLAADALLFPSSAEGLGMVTVEAQAAGLPVLASDTTPRECVVVPEAVRFLPLTEPVTTWASTLLRILDERRMSPEDVSALVSASPFSIENSARSLISLYTSRSGGIPPWP